MCRSLVMLYKTLMSPFLLIIMTYDNDDDADNISGLFLRDIQRLPWAATEHRLNLCVCYDKQDVLFFYRMPYYILDIKLLDMEKAKFTVFYTKLMQGLL